MKAPCAANHALGLAIPLVVAISTTLGARNGLLVRDRRGSEEARNVNVMFFDKTGTLTRGELRVVDVTIRDGLTADEALALAAAVERDSEHTIAQVIQNLWWAPGTTSSRSRLLPGYSRHGVSSCRPLWVQS